MTARPLEVWGCTLRSRSAARAVGEGRAEVRVIVAAPSRIAAARALIKSGLLVVPSESAGSRFLADWATTSDNAAELAVAVAPGQVYAGPQDADAADRYVPWPPP